MCSFFKCVTEVSDGDSVSPDTLNQMTEPDQGQKHMIEKSPSKPFE